MHSQQMFNECIAQTAVNKQPASSRVLSRQCPSVHSLCVDFVVENFLPSAEYSKLARKIRTASDNSSREENKESENRLNPPSTWGIDVCACACFWWFNVLPSSELGGGRQRHPTASSSEALRRT